MVSGAPPSERARLIHDRGEYDIHLLVMGTLGRRGVPGVMIGNTAERLLPEVTCSVLALKPPDFHSPVRPL